MKPIVQALADADEDGLTEHAEPMIAARAFLAKQEQGRPKDLFARLGFDKSAPQPPQPVGLDGYLIDLFVARLPGAEIAKRRREGSIAG
jgi:hypothetical protein